ncbi:ankyrin repeat domain-containing protein [Chlamydiia bacterium]|nr:ankyrin repeat domain-containing protein [Chlamydiia bacterium]
MLTRVILSFCLFLGCCFSELDVFKLARNGEFEMLKDIIENDDGFDVNQTTRGYFKIPLLHEAAKSGSLEFVKYLVETKNANKDAKDTAQKTVLHGAASSGSLELVKYLIETYKTDPRVVDDYGVAVLYNAVQSGSFKLVEYLIEEHNADPHKKQDAFTDNVFEEAFKSGSLDLVKYLINNHDANPHDANKNGKTMLHCAAESGSWRLVDYLVTDHEVNPHAVTNWGFDMLYFAASSGSLDLVRYLIEQQKLSPNDSEEILRKVISKGYVDITRYLIDSGWNYTPGYGVLVEAALSRKNSLNMIKLFIDEYKVDPNAINSIGETVLHKLSKTRQPPDLPTVTYLANLNDTLRAVDKNGYTPLHIAIEAINLRIVKVLIAAGADPKLETNDGKNSLEIARSKHNANPGQVSQDVLSLIEGSIRKSAR